MNRSEIKYILYSGLFALIWFFFALPKLTAYFDGNSPITQFFIFNIGIYFFFFIFLKSVTTGSKTNFLGIIGLMALFLALDTVMPEYHVGFDGTLIPGAMLGLSTTDYIWGYLGQGFGLSGTILFGFVYLVMPVLLLIISAKLLPNFVRRI